MKWRPCLNYKASGVEWLGEVPENWDLTLRPLHRT
jgi:hypothetical protein